MTLARQPARRASSRPPNLLTRGQTLAIQAAMQTFVDEDRAFGRGVLQLRWCVYCQSDRPGPGFIAYECGDFCNACATEFELARAQRLVRTVGEFLEQRGDARPQPARMALASARSRGRGRTWASK
jgi:hypothetical protein